MPLTAENKEEGAFSLFLKFEEMLAKINDMYERIGCYESCTADIICLLMEACEPSIFGILAKIPPFSFLREGFTSRLLRPGSSPNAKLIVNVIRNMMSSFNISSIELSDLFNTSDFSRKIKSAITKSDTFDVTVKSYDHKMSVSLSSVLHNASISLSDPERIYPEGEALSPELKKHLKGLSYSNWPLNKIVEGLVPMVQNVEKDLYKLQILANITNADDVNNPDKKGSFLIEEGVQNIRQTFEPKPSSSVVVLGEKEERISISLLPSDCFLAVTQVNDLCMSSSFQFYIYNKDGEILHTKFGKWTPFMMETDPHHRLWMMILGVSGTDHNYLGTSSSIVNKFQGGQLPNATAETIIKKLQSLDSSEREQAMRYMGFTKDECKRLLPELHKMSSALGIKELDEFQASLSIFRNLSKTSLIDFAESYKGITIMSSEKGPKDLGSSVGPSGIKTVILELFAQSLHAFSSFNSVGHLFPCLQHLYSEHKYHGFERRAMIFPLPKIEIVEDGRK
jgi:hypothetical protein